MLTKNIERDERTTFIENKSYKYGSFIFNFGLLIDIFYRSIKFNEAPWDLFGLLFLSSFVITAFQYKQKVFTKDRKKNYSFLIIFIAILSIASAFIITKLK